MISESFVHGQYFHGFKLSPLTLAHLVTYYQKHRTDDAGATDAALPTHGIMNVQKLLKLTTESPWTSMIFQTQTSKPPLISLIWLRPPFGRAIVRSPPPPLPRSCVSPLLLVFLQRSRRRSRGFSVVSFVLEDGACLIVPVSSSCLEFLSGVLLGFRLGVSVLRLCFPPVFSGGLHGFVLNCSRMEVGSWFTNSPVNAAPEVVYPSVPLFYTDYGLNGCIRSRLKDKKAAIFEFVSRQLVSLPCAAGGGKRQEAVGTVQSRFKGDFLSDSWQPSTFPALLRSHGLSSPRFSPQLWIWLLSSIEL
ncbi:hypothetical protein YC2023_077896 [Brassica napus]